MDVTGTATWEDAHAPEPECEPIAPDPPEGWEPDDELGTIYEGVGPCPHCGASELRNIYTRHGTGTMFHARNCPAHTEENNRAAWHASFDDRDHLRALHRCGVEIYHAVKARHNGAGIPADVQQDREATLRHLKCVLTELEDAMGKEN